MDLVPENSSSANKRTTAGGRVKWSAALEKLLIDLWQEKIEDLRGPRKNSHVYMEMAESMKEAGIELGWGEIRTKLENMTKKYRIETWINNMEQSTLDNDNPDEYFSDIIEMDLDGSCSSSTLSGPPPKKKKKTDISLLAEIAQERLEQQKGHHVRQDKMVQDFISTQTKFQNDLLEVLKNKNK
ncbi:uncharacterized protein [Drosophila pseudoobscura]|uniref:Uncharacterized protein isoform X1 n=1 Tax=Drosophila pseudoobscura pseudoobscura TaxID=46245 RepID=A0A6I8VJN3_DROPS|nr:uncharacterized protein LOC26532491 isoform X1 [Drosophila pseudoobscura]